jgi:hypothetical protein
MVFLFDRDGSPVGQKRVGMGWPPSSPSAADSCRSGRVTSRGSSGS